MHEQELYAFAILQKMFLLPYAASPVRNLDPGNITNAIKLFSILYRP